MVFGKRTGGVFGRKPLSGASAVLDAGLAWRIRNAPVGPSGDVEIERAVAVLSAANDLLKVWFAGDMDRNTVVEAVGWISEAFSGMRDEAEQVLYAQYLEDIEAGSCDFASAQVQLDWEVEYGGGFSNPVAARCASDIWSLVRFYGIGVGREYTGELYIQLLASAAWDGEHGAAVRSTNYGPLTKGR